MVRSALWYVLCLVLLVPCAAPAEEKVEVAVGGALDALHRAASEADGTTYFSLFADNAVYMGTDASERWSVDEFKAFAEPYFSKGRGWTYEVKDRHISVAADGGTAWFDEILWNGSYGTCRGTGVLVRISGVWRIAQYHLTIPIPNEMAKDVVAQIRSLESPGK